MRQVVSVEKGGVKCSSTCRYYAEDGCVKGVLGVPLKTHCCATMQTIIIDCDQFNPNTIEKLLVTDEQWQAMQRAIGKRAQKERKPYDPNHDVIHPVGCEWTRSKGRWNATKSSNIRN